MAARASHKSVDAPLKEEHKRFHEAASWPDGPAAPSIHNTVYIMSGSVGRLSLQTKQGVVPPMVHQA